MRALFDQEMTVRRLRALILALPPDGAFGTWLRTRSKRRLVDQSSR